MSDVAFAVNQSTFNTVFSKALVSIGKQPFDGSSSIGPLWIGVEGAIHIDDAGSVDFEDGDTFFLHELDMGWDSLILRLGIDLPTIEVGKFCVFRFPDDTPFVGGDCIFEFPGVTLFDGAPDIGPLKINLNAIIGFIVTEISGRFTISVRKDGDYQKIYADPQAIDFDPLSINDTFGKLPAILKAAVVALAAVVVSKVPQVWLLDVLLGIIGLPSVTQWILNLLDIGDDTEEWLTDKLNFSIGIDDLLAQAIFEIVLNNSPLFKIADPFPFVPELNALPEDFGGWAGPAPITPQFTIPATKAGLINVGAAFDEDHLFIRFDFAI
jgi:uncharacterized membrane protein YeaQ/YmgE (transglycosylase-associated protein family)